ncbi:MAG: carbon starvation protein A [Marinilabiliales bacterium]
MFTLIISIVILISGYMFYGRFIVKFFGENPNSVTPAININDNVDFIPLPTWKVFVIQFLNIAGLGPIFGAILGAMYGPASYIWIVLGCIFMGAVHDYFSGMISLRNGGISLPEMVGKYLGNGIKNFLRIFTLLLLIFVGVAFVTGPAGLLNNFSGGGKIYWVIGIFIYYLLATLLPINKIIGKVYPFFGIALLLMAVMVFGYMLLHGFTDSNFTLNELSFDQLKNLHSNPSQNILYPMMFIVLSCGAISGFHSTQSPMMARCLKNEKNGRMAFYGAMIAEGIVALIWATAAMNYFGDTLALNDAMTPKEHDPAWVVNEICQTWFGKSGAIMAIIGVIVLPITTGDTAFRSARLTVSDMFKVEQKNILKRLYISIPIFIIGIILSQLDFKTIWKYLGLSNQILACIVLWTSAAYLVKSGKTHWLLSIPAMFLTAVCTTYFIVAPYKNGGLELNPQTGNIIGIIMSIIVFIVFYFFIIQKQKKEV